MPRFSRTLRLALLACLLLVTHNALAETPAADRALAEVLFREARSLLEQGKTTQACAKFEESYRLDEALGTLLNLAVCHETEGLLASAWGEYNQAVTMARQRGDQERMEFAQQGSVRLEGRLLTVRIELAPGSQTVQGLKLRVGSRNLGAASIDTPIPVDPGQHEVRVEAEGYQPWSSVISVAPGSGETRVEVPALVPIVAATADEPAPVPAHESRQVAVDRTADDGSGRRTLGIVLGTVGVVAVGVGGAFGIRAIQKKGERDDLCEGGVCSSQEGIDAHRAASTSATVANIAIGAGLAALTAGVVLFLTAPDAVNTAQIGIEPLPQGAAMTWERSW